MGHHFKSPSVEFLRFYCMLHSSMLKPLKAIVSKDFEKYVLLWKNKVSPIFLGF